jgi:hypothetical protein
MTTIKKITAVAVLLICFCCIAGLFWYSEWQYSLPTPVPGQYQPVAIGDHIDISAKYPHKKDRPLFLHFFNPDCPCSRFNVPHFKELAASYGSKIDFAVVVMTKDRSYTQNNIRERFGLTVPVIFDTSIARDCGVYSTPQAVLMNTGGSLYYRGNYNRSRYCTDKKSNYAQLAIDSLLRGKQQVVFNSYALTAYGCSLPSCKK